MWEKIKEEEKMRYQNKHKQEPFNHLPEMILITFASLRMGFVIKIRSIKQIK